MEHITLSNGVKMPIVGYGVFKITDPVQCQQLVEQALDVGYRHIDTAQYYQNEEAVGKAIENSPVDREDIFLTTKVWHRDYGEGNTEQAIEGSLRRLRTDYLDLVLLHQPYNDIYGAWRDLEKLYRQGKIRAIGISNFHTDRFLDLHHNSSIAPMVNQVETHVFNAQKELREYSEEYGTVVEAWAPFAQAQLNFFNNKVLQEVAEKHNKTVGQVGLRYLIEQNIPVIPKTEHKSRMKENINVFDFELDDEDKAKIDALDKEKTVQHGHRHPVRVLDIINR